MPGMMGAGPMDNENDGMDAGDDGSEMADLEARVSKIEQILGIGQSASPAPAPKPSFGGKPAMGGKPASPFYGG